MNNVISALDEQVGAMSEDIRAALASTTLGQYVNWVDMVYHLTYGAGPRLGHAASTATLEDLRVMLAEMEKDERNHYRLAEMDLKAFERRPSAQAPEEVGRWERYWYGIREDTQAAYLGALYVFETLAPRVAADVDAFMKRLGIQPTQSRFLREHVEADVQHTARCHDMCVKYSDAHGATIVEAGRAAMPLINAALRNPFIR